MTEERGITRLQQNRCRLAPKQCRECRRVLGTLPVVHGHWAGVRAGGGQPGVLRRTACRRVWHSRGGCLASVGGPARSYTGARLEVLRSRCVACHEDQEHIAPFRIALRTVQGSWHVLNALFCCANLSLVPRGQHCWCGTQFWGQGRRIASTVVPVPPSLLHTTFASTRQTCNSVSGSVQPMSYRLSVFVASDRCWVYGMPSKRHSRGQFQAATRLLGFWSR